MRRVEAHLAQRRRCGFATPVALGLVAVTGLLSVGALHDALFGEQLAGSRLLHQRAAAWADQGIRDAMARIAAATTPLETSYAPELLPATNDSVSVTIRHLRNSELPAGFSAARFATHHFQIESTGHVARDIRLTQVQGAVRVMPAPAVPE